MTEPVTRRERDQLTTYAFTVEGSDDVTLRFEGVDIATAPHTSAKGVALIKIANHLSDQTGWRPIATVPNVDCRILVIGGRHQEAEIRRADGEWWNTSKTGPTHWMPIPPLLPDEARLDPT